MKRLFLLLSLIALPMEQAVATQFPDTLSKIQDTKTIAIGYSSKSLPISYAETNGDPAGYSVDICKRIVAGLERELHLAELKVKWVAGSTRERLAGVADGALDLECGTTTVTLTRQEKVDFSNFVFVESGGILVRAEANVHALSDLAGKKIGVTPGTTTEKRLRSTLQDRLINAKPIPIKDASEGMGKLENWDLDAVASDRMVLLGQVALSGDPDRFAMLKTDFSLDPYAFALRRGDPDFRLAVNRVLAHLYRSGEINKIFSRWFGKDAQPTPLLRAIYFLFGFSD